MSDIKFEELFEEALSVRENSHSPYSQFKVASSLIADNGKHYTGVNIENSSYGATVCAERIAIFKAISEGAKKIKSLLVVAKGDIPVAPCGVCRQVMSEFMDDDSIVYYANLNKEYKKKHLKELLPDAFDKSMLP